MSTIARLLFVLLIFPTTIFAIDTDNDGLSDDVELTSFFIGEDFQVNTYTTNSQWENSVASNGNTYMITWQTMYSDGSINVFAQLFDASGSKVGYESQVNTYTTLAQSTPSVASNGSSYLMAWRSLGQDGAYAGVFAQLLDAAGNNSGSEFQVNTYTTHNQEHPSVASNGSSYIVTWDSYGQDGSEYGVYAQCLDSNGTPVGSEIQVNTYTTNMQYNTCVTGNGSSYLIVWQSDLQDGSTYGIFAQLIDEYGNKVGQEMQVNTYTTDIQDSPYIASNGESYMVVWQSNGQDGSYNGIFGQLFDSSGNKIGTEMQVNTYTTGYQSSPCVASDGNNYMVAWNTQLPGSSKQKVVAQLFDNIGNKIGTEFQANTDTVYEQYYPAMASNGFSYMVSWMTNNRDGSNQGVFASRIGYTNPTVSDTDNDGMPDGFEVYNGLDCLADDSSSDIDNDGLTNIEEFQAGTRADNPDSDNDGLNDGYESSLGTSPLTSDSDNDGMPDGWEITYSLNPLADDSNQDKDNDGVQNGDEYSYGTYPTITDSDNDGLSDGSEVNTHQTQPANPDTDGDSLLDGQEILLGSNPLVDDSLIDTDNDGVTNLTELLCATNPNKADTDNDGLSDYDELIYYSMLDQMEVNAYTTGYRSNPCIATDGSAYLVVWSAHPSGTYNDEIYGQFLDISGNPLGNEFQINTYTTNNQTFPYIASNGSSYLAVWMSYEQDGSYNGVYGQLLDTSGTPIGTEIQVNTYTTGSQNAPQVATDGSSYFVIWENNNAPEKGVFGQRIDASGNKTGDQFKIGEAISEMGYYPAVASNGSSYFVVWRDYAYDMNGSGSVGQILDVSGNKIGSDFLINTYTEGNQDYASVSSNGVSYLVAWESSSGGGTAQDGDGCGVFAQMFDGSGNKIGTEFQVNTYTTGQQHTSYIASNGSSYLITWTGTDYDPQVWSNNVYGQRFDSMGNKLGEELQMSTSSTAYNNQMACCAAGMASSYLIAWTGSYPVTYDTVVLERIVSYDADPADPDTDNDGMPDGYEYYNGLDLGSDDADDDLDNDGLNNGDEYFYGTKVNIADSDNDGQSDLFEIYAATNPLDAQSSFVAWLSLNDDGDVVLQWPSDTGLSYSMYVKDGIQGDFLLYQQHIAGQSSKTSFVDTGVDADSNGSYTDAGDIAPSSDSTIANRFYKVVVE